jgi:ATP-dependent protease HslVU (ClpYQ) peptidase subunit
MSCIVAFYLDKHIVLSSDVNISSENYSSRLNSPKIFKNGDMFIGAVGSCKQLHVLRFFWKCPKIKKGQDKDEYMYRDVLKSLIDCFGENKIEGENLNSFIIVWDKRIFIFQEDLSIIQTDDKIISVGIVGDFADGLFTGMLKNIKDIELSDNKKPDTSIMKNFASDI